MKAIKNPLTIIAAFSSLAEVAGTVVLLKLPTDLQHIFIWFVIFFPALLVVAFFLTLNFNPTVLYAPSDFSDETNYMKAIEARRLTASQLEKIDLGSISELSPP